MTNQAHRWWGQSPTSIGTYLSCPLMFKEKYLLKKHPFVESEASRYGNRFHATAELRLLYDEPEAPEFLEFKPVFDSIRSLPGKLHAEVELAVNAAFEPCDMKDYRNKELGNKIDVLVVDNDYARIIDWKTGKRYDDPLQIDINAVTVFSNFPQVNRIRARYLYTKTGEFGMTKNYYRTAAYVTSGADEPLVNVRQGLRMHLLRMQNAFKEDRFRPNRNGLCKNFCPVHDCPMNGHYTK